VTNERTHRLIAIVGYVAAVVGIIGFVVAPGAAFVWAFLIVFGLVKLPQDVWNLWKRRRSPHGKDASN
jgi:hypothetical protein